MKNIDVDYIVFRNGEAILDTCYATVGLTDKNVQEVADFIRDNHYSGELVDVPSHVYDRIMKGVISTAIKDMKTELKDYLLESDEVVLQEVLPVTLLDLLPDDVVELVDLEKIQAYYDQYEDNDEEEYIPIDGGYVVEDTDQSELIYDSDKQFFEIVGEEEPNKENTLYLTISQKNFDLIMEGKKTCEEREIKETTYKKLLDCAEDGAPYYDTRLMPEDAPHAGDIYVWNDGVYPFFPNPSLRYLNLAVGYNKERDTALVELSGFKFKPMPNKKGIIPRFTCNGEDAKPDPNGDLCFWCIELHVRRIVECHRK